MTKKNSGLWGRRDVLKSSALFLGGTVMAADSLAAYPKTVNTNSSPSTLKITDMRVANVVKPGPSPCLIIRIDTNQGVYGLERFATEPVRPTPSFSRAAFWARTR